MRAFVQPIVCALVLVPTLIFADDPPAQKRYSIKQNEPTTGSHIRQRIADSSLPLDKRYSELTKEQQNAVKSQYEQMADNDEPPFPADGLGPLYKAISEVQKYGVGRWSRLGVEGLLALHVQVDSEGNATSVSVYQSPDTEIGKSAAAVAMLTRYKPAVCGGRPCAMAFPVRVQLCAGSLSGCASDQQDATAYYNRGVAWSEKGDYDRAIADYTEAIRLVPQYALPYFGRGFAWSRKGDYDRAIADYTEAIQINPKYAPAYGNRGNAWSTKGDYDRAIADYDKAIRLNPQYASVYLRRSRAHFFLGRFDASLQDVTESLRLNVDGNQTYAIIWSYIAQSRSGKPELAMRELSAKLGTLDQTKWPAPVIDFLVGKSAPDALLKAAEHPDTEIRRGQVCEAEFYLAQWHLLNLRLTDARDLLSHAEKNCPTNFIEYNAAVAELKRTPR